MYRTYIRRQPVPSSQTLGTRQPVKPALPHNLVTCVSPARSCSSTCRDSRTTPRPSATTPPGASSARSARIVARLHPSVASGSPSGWATAAWCVAVEQQDAIEFVLDLEHAPPTCAPAHSARRAGDRPCAAVRRRRLHRLGGQHGLAPVRPRPERRGADADDAARTAARGRHGRAVRRSRAAGIPRVDRASSLCTGVPAPVDSDTGELWTRTPFI